MVSLEGDVLTDALILGRRLGGDTRREREEGNALGDALILGRRPGGDTRRERDDSLT